MALTSTGVQPLYVVNRDLITPCYSAPRKKVYTVLKVLQLQKYAQLVFLDKRKLPWNPARLVQGLYDSVELHNILFDFAVFGWIASYFSVCF